MRGADAELMRKPPELHSLEPHLRQQFSVSLQVCETVLLGTTSSHRPNLAGVLNIAPTKYPLYALWDLPGSSWHFLDHRGPSWIIMADHLTSATSTFILVDLLSEQLSRVYGAPARLL
jgi:hypothetical protein